jgi:hypothetical protein
VVSHVDAGIDPIKKHEIAFDPVAKGEELNVDVTSACGGFLCVTHCGAPIVVFEEEGCSLLRNVEVPKDAANV